MAVKLVIIGGVAGGATAAARARRLDESAQIVVFERGEHISFANCGLPYYIGGAIEERDDLLVTTKKSFAKRYNIDVRTNTEVTRIFPNTREVEAVDSASGKTYRERYDYVLLSPGAEPAKPPIPGIDLPGVYRLRNIPDADRIKTHVDERSPKTAVVVGAGFIGLEMVENLVDRGCSVTVVEMLNQVMPPFDPEMAGLIQAHLKDKGVDLRLGEQVSTIEEPAHGLAVRLKSGDSVPADLVVMSIGVTPENKLAKQANLQLGERGGIVVNSAMRTSDPRIYAVGDAVVIRDYITGFPTMIALAGPANKQARIAADNIMGRASVYRGSIGASIVKVFDIAAASVGLSEKQLNRYELPYLVSNTHSGSHASYYPGAEKLSIKLMFSPGNGRVLGAQIVGGEGVDKRIDVIATAIHGAMTVFDLEELELAYAPPYSSAKDPVNVAGAVAANVMRGDLEAVQWDYLDTLDAESYTLLDVRTPEELQEVGKAPGAVNIPIDELREKLDELDKTKTQILFCEVGLRGYVAHRILKQKGFDSENISGGFTTYEAMKESSGESVAERATSAKK